MMITTAAEYSVDKRQVAAAFNRAAAGYASRAVLQNTVAQRLDERLDVVRIRPAVVLDLGAGCGNGSRLLARRYAGAEIIALDIALEMLRMGRSGWRWWLSRRRYVCGDAECVPLADTAVDLVYSNLALQWCNDLDAALRECRRVLRTEGLFMFTTLGPDTLMELRQSWAAADSAVHVNAFVDMHDVGDALIRAGFASPVLDVERLTLTYPDVRALMHDLKALGAHNVTAGRPHGLTGKARLQAMVEAYEERRRGGVIPATYEIVYGHAWVPARGTRPQDGSTVATFPLHQLQRQRRNA
ncbi:MAG: malonyl-ACP O-methyltransferase BioC [Chromatiales bacterium]